MRQPRNSRDAAAPQTFDDEPVRSEIRPRAHSFHLRIWPQVGEGAGSKSLWRGYVAELSGANTRYFDDGNKLARILDEVAGARFPGLGNTREEE